MDIIIDSNIFISDFTLKSSNWEVLLDFVRKTESKIIIPQVILDEVCVEYKRVFLSLASDYEKITKKLHRHCSSCNFENIEKNKIEDYVSFLQKKIKIETFPYKNDFLPKICHRAINRIKPAKKDGKDFRDILIWLSIKEICIKGEHKQVVFISQNTTDFANNRNQLHEDLSSECRAEGIDVRYYTSIGTFVTEFINQYSEKLNVYNKEWLESNLNFQEIEDQLKDMLEKESWSDFFDYAGEFNASSYQVKYIEPMHIEQYGGYILPDGNTILNVDMKGNVYIEAQYIDYYRDKMYEGDTVNAGSIEFGITIKISNGSIISTYVNNDYCI
jgi:predicted nucleic acid-binding protein